MNSSTKNIAVPRSLRNSHRSFRFLSALQESILNSTEENVVIDFTNCEFSHSLFTSFIGALVFLGRSNNKTVSLSYKKGSVLSTYFRRSGLYNFFAEDDTIFTNKFAIPFNNVESSTDDLVGYISNIIDLAPIHLTEIGEEALFKNIYEIFDNAIEHSRPRCGVFSCGHWMPKANQLAFSVYDTGIGIPDLVKQKIDSSFTSHVALAWALAKGNSTKQMLNDVPRGLGLSDLFDFIKLNNGTLIIFSNDIYFRYRAGNVHIEYLDSPIIGTMIGIIIKNDPDKIYTRVPEGRRL